MISGALWRLSRGIQTVCMCPRNPTSWAREIRLHGPTESKYVGPRNPTSSTLMPFPPLPGFALIALFCLSERERKWRNWFENAIDNFETPPPAILHFLYSSTSVKLHHFQLLRPGLLRWLSVPDAWSCWCTILTHVPAMPDHRFFSSMVRNSSFYLKCGAVKSTFEDGEQINRTKWYFFMPLLTLYQQTIYHCLYSSSVHTWTRLYEVI